MSEENSSLRKAQTPLSQRPALAVLSILFLYIITEITSDSMARALASDNRALGILIKLAFFSALAFIVVPFLLRLPAGRSSIGSYLRNIGLKVDRSPGRLLTLALSCYLIFALSQTLGSSIFHLATGQEYSLDFSRHGLLDSRSIIAGIFEEIILRGVIVAVLLTRLPKKKTILVSAGVFAGLHLLNMLNPEAEKAWVLCQVIWAFGLGIMYASLLVEWRSLYPLIILHYLINALVGVWFRGLDTRTLNSGLYGILFFGLLPAGLSMLWARYLFSRRALAEKEIPLRNNALPIGTRWPSPR